MISVGWLPTLIMRGYFLFFPRFLTHNSLIVYLKISLSLIACNEGIQTHTFLSLYKKSKSAIGTICQW